MKIQKIELGYIDIPLVTPFKTALRTVSSVNDLIVKITAEDGSVGYGEAPPTAVITGDTKESIEAAIRGYIAPAITGMELEPLEDVMQKMEKSIAKNTSAKAAVDIALYDLFAKIKGQPLFRLLAADRPGTTGCPGNVESSGKVGRPGTVGSPGIVGSSGTVGSPGTVGSSGTGGCSGEVRTQLETDITISVNETEEMVRDSLRAMDDGFHILKVKVGKGGEKDVERIREIRRAIGEQAVIRVDANQGWSREEAVRTITAMEDAGLNIELVEQPVSYHDFKGMQYVTNKVQTPILADESVFSYEDAIRIIEEHAADFINIKLMKTGGIHEALRICDAAEQNQVKCMIGCMLESKVSVSAGAHLAGARSCITMADLDGPSLCKIDPYTSGPVYTGPGIFLPETPGIGITKMPVEFFEV